MCCSLIFLINSFKLTCFLEIILSIICLAKQIQTANYENELFVEGINDYKQKGQMIYLSLFLISLFFGIIGFVYSYKKIKWFIPMIFNLALIGYFSSLIPDHHFPKSTISQYLGDDISDCLNISLFKSSQNIYSLSNDFWCQKDCPCSIKDPTKWEPFFWNKYVYNSGIPTDKFQECQYFQSKFKTKVGLSDEEFNKQTNFLIALESRFECSSLCQVDKIFRFNSVSDGLPDQNAPCQQLLIDFINSFIGSFRLVGVVGLSLNIVQFYLLTSHIILEKKNQNKIASSVNPKGVTLPKSNHDESYIKKKGDKQKDVL